MKIVALLLLLCAQEKKAPDDILFERDVVYGKGGEEELKLNLGRPKELTGPTPASSSFTAAAGRRGTRTPTIPRSTSSRRRATSRRRSPTGSRPSTSFPAQIEDVKCAMRFLRANADKYQIDKDRIGAVGFSAGAHLSMLLGTMDKDDGCEGEGGNPDQPSKVNAVVACSARPISRRPTGPTGAASSSSSSAAARSRKSSTSTRRPRR